jgi:hypothetical protein
MIARLYGLGFEVGQATTQTFREESLSRENPGYRSTESVDSLDFGALHYNSRRWVAMLPEEVRGMAWTLLILLHKPLSTISTSY